MVVPVAREALVGFILAYDTMDANVLQSVVIIGIPKTPDVGEPLLFLVTSMKECNAGLASYHCLPRDVGLASVGGTTEVRSFRPSWQYRSYVQCYISESCFFWDASSCCTVAQGCAEQSSDY